MVVLEFFDDGLEAAFPGVALMERLLKIERAGGFGVSFAFQELDFKRL